MMDKNCPICNAEVKSIDLAAPFGPDKEQAYDCTVCWWVGKFSPKSDYVKPRKGKK